MKNFLKNFLCFIGWHNVKEYFKVTEWIESNLFLTTKKVLAKGKCPQCKKECYITTTE